MSFIKEHFFTIILVTLFILSVTASAYRFYFLKDYDVTYEVECDPYAEQCFTYCEDDSCEDVFYYKYITKQANDLLSVCGVDITDCEAASTCADGQVSCEIEFCTDGSEECEDLEKLDQDFNIDEVIEINQDL